VYSLLNLFVVCIDFAGWYRQYDAHKDDFIERYGNSTEQWLFHGILSTLHYSDFHL